MPPPARDVEQHREGQDDDHPDNDCDVDPPSHWGGGVRERISQRHHRKEHRRVPGCHGRLELSLATRRLNRDEEPDPGDQNQNTEDEGGQRARARRPLHIHAIRRRRSRLAGDNLPSAQTINEGDRGPYRQLRSATEEFDRNWLRAVVIERVFGGIAGDGTEATRLPVSGRLASCLVACGEETALLISSLD